MGKLTARTILRRALELDVRLRAVDDVAIEIEGRQVHPGVWGLAILNAFAEPRSLADDIRSLRGAVTGDQDLENLDSTIRKLYGEGVLCAAGGAKGALRARGFGGAKIHARMLDDRARTSAFLKAIAEVVQPGDVVVDLGTGTGVLAVAAARAGARRVYAIEASGIGRLAREVFAANGVADRVTLVEGWSTRVTLPERADVLVSEMIGNEPVAEDILPLTADARIRFLHPGSRSIPDALDVYALPVTVPAEELRRTTFSPGSVRDWSRWYGLDCSALEKAFAAEPRSLFVLPQEARNWPALTAPVLLGRARLGGGAITGPIGEFRSTSVGGVDWLWRERMSVPVETRGLLNGILVYFEVQLSPRVRLSTAPDSAAGTNHWTCVVWTVPDAREVHPGETLELTHAYTGRSRPRVGVRW